MYFSLLSFLNDKKQAYEIHVPPTCPCPCVCVCVCVRVCVGGGGITPGVRTCAVRATVTTVFRGLQ